MTFKEKLMQEHPECISEDFIGGCRNCPRNYGYERRGNGLCHSTKARGDAACRACWDREMPITPEEQEVHDLAINAEIIQGYCRGFVCDECPVEDVCIKELGSWSNGFISASATQQRAMLDAFEATLAPLDEDEEEQEEARDLAINAEIIQGYCRGFICEVPNNDNS